MFERLVVPLVLADILENVNGRTRFQKLMFLIQKEAENDRIEGLDFDFEMYLHGPFSRDLSSVIHDLVDEGYLEEQKTETSLGYTKYVYKLKKKGRELLAHAKRKGVLSAKMSRLINDVLKDYGNMPLPELVERAYEKF